MTSTEAHLVVTAEKLPPHAPRSRCGCKHHELVSREEADTEPRMAIDLRRRPARAAAPPAQGAARRRASGAAASCPGLDGADGDGGARARPGAGPPVRHGGLRTAVESISVARLFEDQREELQLELLTESLASRREITVSDIQSPRHGADGVRRELPARAHPDPGADRARPTSPRSPEPRCARRSTGCSSSTMPLIVVCKGLEVPPYLIQRANECQVPVLRTPQSTTPFIHSLTLYLDHMFAPADVGARLAGGRLRLRAAVHRAQRDRQVGDRARPGRARPPAGGRRRRHDHARATATC